jgi:hypothetical protein
MARLIFSGWALVAVAALLVGLLGSSAHAQRARAGWSAYAQAVVSDAAPIGKVESVTGTATIEHTGEVIARASLSTGEIPAKQGDPVYRGDIVRTGAPGNLALVFVDGTTFKLETNARMELNEFVYDPKGSSNSTLFNLQKGAFTFLAGATAKNGNMRIETPVATMGIRGTAPHVEIADDGTVKFSTLIEENKKNEQSNSSPAPAPVPGVQRKAENPPPARGNRRSENRPLRSSLEICRGC